MEKEFDELTGKTVIEDDSIDEATLEAIYRYLDNKKIVDYHGTIENPSERFLYDALSRTHHNPKYIDSVENFIKSDFVSNIIKKKVLDLTSDKDGYDNLNLLLKTNKNINSYTDVDIALMNKAVKDYSKDKSMLPEIFEEYIFALDGYGPVEFIKKSYTKSELAKNFLIHSGLIPASNYYVGVCINKKVLGEDHLTSIYSMYEKYMPEEKSKFLDVVKYTKELNAFDFISNYISFVSNDFSCEEFKHDNRKYITNEYDKKLDEKENSEIRKKFLDNVHKKEKVLKKRK